jgi:DNA-binding NarL/FixJ family response regulator
VPAGVPTTYADTVISVLITDNHLLVAEGFRAFLGRQLYEVTGAVTDARSLLREARRNPPNAVLLDLTMSDVGRILKAELPRTRIVVISTSEDAEIASMVLRDWASGYLLKRSTGAELYRAISEVVAGREYVTPLMARKLDEALARDPNPRGPRLTERRREVLRLLAGGQSMIEAASILNITTRTIAFHKYAIMDSFGLKNNSDVVRLAMRERLIPEC